jgi:hypothetical protein
MFTKKLKLGIYFAVAVFLTLGLSVSLQSVSASLFETVGTSVHIGNTGISVADGQNLLWGELGAGSSGTGSFVLLQKDGADKFRVDHDGNVTATSFIYSSDRNLNQDIKVIPNALDKVLKLDGVMFNWKADNRPDLGLIAQEVEEVFPELVHTNGATNLKSVEYGNLVAPIIEAIKEQQKQIEELKNQNLQLQRQINGLKK